MASGSNLLAKLWVPWEPDSQQNMFYDERIKKYVAYLRAGRNLMNLDVDAGEWADGDALRSR